MSRVALTALDPAIPTHDNAEREIVNSSLGANSTSPQVNEELIRIAFDPRWERVLRPEDRRLAVALATAGMLGKELPDRYRLGDSLKQQLINAHPAVLLAITATANDAVAENVLTRIPAGYLNSLQPPIGGAFETLLGGRTAITCNEPSVRAFSRMVAHGVRNLDDLVAYLPTEARQRLRALAQLFAHDPAQARSVLEYLLKDRRVRLDLEEIKWAKDWDLIEWKEIDSSDQFFILVGVPPAAEPTVQHVGQMFLHPDPAIRGFAIKQALKSIKLRHPGAYEIFQALQTNPAILSPQQTVTLARFLESPARITSKTAREWLATNPPKELIIKLLVSAASANRPTTLDFELMRELQRQNWQPDFDTLVVLSNHPEELTRMFAYKSLANQDNYIRALSVLEKARENETSRLLKRHLERIIETLDAE